MWTVENRARYDRSKLRYPSDLTDAGWALARREIPRAERGHMRLTPWGGSLAPGYYDDILLLDDVDRFTRLDAGQSQHERRRAATRRSAPVVTSMAKLATVVSTPQISMSRAGSRLHVGSNRKGRLDKTPRVPARYPQKARLIGRKDAGA